MWIWWSTQNGGISTAEIDYKSYNAHKYPLFSREKIDPADYGCPVFHTKSSSKKFKNRHTVPTNGEIVVDEVVKNIILSTQEIRTLDFFPVKISCNDGIIDYYYILYVYARAECIDYEKSDIEEMVFYEERPFIRYAKSFVYKDGCMGEFQIARERDHGSHLIVSDNLKEKLLIIDEFIEFRTPRDVSEPRYYR